MNNSQIIRKTALENLMKEGSWQLVSEILQRGLPEPYREMVIQRAIRRLDYPQLSQYILPHCSDDQLESYLDTLIATFQWAPVQEFLKYFALNRWSPHLEYCFRILVMRGKWSIISDVIDIFSVSDSARRLAFKEASERANDLEFERYILPHYSEDMLELVLINLVRRGMWWIVKKVLSMSNPECRKALEDDGVLLTPKTVSDQEIFKYLLPYIPEDQIKFVLTVFVEEGKWRFLDSMLMRGVSESTEHWVCTFKGILEFETLLHRFSDVHLNWLLLTLAHEGHWASVEFVFRKCTNSQAHIVALLEAIEKLENSKLCHYILPHCTEENMKEVLATFVKRGFWESVGGLLVKNISDSLRWWAIEEASNKADDSEFCVNILPYLHTYDCLEKNLEEVLATLVKRGLWGSVSRLMAKNISDSQRWWATEEASKKLGCKQFAELFLVYCDDSQLEALLPRLVEHKLWQCVRVVIERGELQRRQAIEEAWKRANSQDFFNHILPCCSEEHMDIVLAHPKSSSRPNCVHDAFKNLYKMDRNEFVVRVLYNIGMGNDPLRVLYGRKHSIFNMGVAFKKQWMVAECIRLGFSTHQPQLTDHTEDILQMNRLSLFNSLLAFNKILATHPTSPFLHAVLQQPAGSFDAKTMPVVASMLYESGSCSNAELFSLFVFFQCEFETVLDNFRLDRQRDPWNYPGINDRQLNTLASTIETVLPYLKEMATNPRSLMSMCRLVISHSLSIRRIRTRDVQQLPLNEKMKNYVMFSELTDPDYSPYS